MSCLEDPSRQYVLDPAAPYLRNLAALWAVDPELARGIEALDDDAAYPVERSRDGEPTARVPTTDGRHVYVHSRYQPLVEAQRLVETVDTEACVAFYVHGMGLGYHVEQLFDRISREAIVCVLEPDLRMLRTAFEHRDLSRLIASRRVYFFTKPDRTALLAKLTG
jgi:hypothetical protein